MVDKIKDKDLNINVNVTIKHDSEVVLKLDKILERLEKPMAESPEVAAFRERVNVALANVSADIERLLARATGLSEEDKAAFHEIATNLENVAAKVPEEAEADKRRR